MFLEIILSVSICVLFILIAFNINKIKDLEKKTNYYTEITTKKIRNLSSQISLIVNKNNEVNIKNIQSLILKLEEIENISTKNDNDLSIELENLKKKLTFLMENSEVYSFGSSSKKK